MLGYAIKFEDNPWSLVSPPTHTKPEPTTLSGWMKNSPQFQNRKQSEGWHSDEDNLRVKLAFLKGPIVSSPPWTVHYEGDLLSFRGYLRKRDRKPVKNDQRQQGWEMPDFLFITNGSCWASISDPQEIRLDPHQARKASDVANSNSERSNES